MRLDVKIREVSVGQKEQKGFEQQGRQQQKRIFIMRAGLGLFYPYNGVGLLGGLYISFKRQRLLQRPDRKRRFARDGAWRRRNKTGGLLPYSDFGLSCRGIYIGAFAKTDKAQP